MTNAPGIDSQGRVLVLGYGNPGRLDDGLGPAVAEAVDGWRLDGVTASADYQLTVEDGYAAAGHEVVIFADAAAQGPAPYAWTRVRPEGASSFTTHSVTPQAVLGVASACFGAQPRAYVLAVRGYAFDAFGERLSPGARRNLAAAVAFLAEVLRTGRFEDDPSPEVEAECALRGPQ